MGIREITEHKDIAQYAECLKQAKQRFETMYQDELEILVHADLEDSDQTVTIDKPGTPQTGDALVDVTLVQTASGVEVARESASLAYVAGAGGGPITVRAMASPERELARLQEPRVYAFDPAWLGEQGDSGYDVAWPMYRPLKIILR